MFIKSADQEAYRVTVRDVESGNTRSDVFRGTVAKVRKEAMATLGMGREVTLQSVVRVRA